MSPSSASSAKPKRQILHPKRTKGGRVPSEVTKDELQELFHLPMENAAQKLGVGLTVLKQICRKFGIARWPFRKVLQLKRLASIVKDAQTLLPVIMEMQVPPGSKLWSHFDGKCREKIDRALRALEARNQQQQAQERSPQRFRKVESQPSFFGLSSGSPTSPLEAMTTQPSSSDDFDDNPGLFPGSSFSQLPPEFLAAMPAGMMQDIMCDPSLAATSLGSVKHTNPNHPLWQTLLTMAVCAATGNEQQVDHQDSMVGYDLMEDTDFLPMPRRMMPMPKATGMRMVPEACLPNAMHPTPGVKWSGGMKQRDIVGQGASQSSLSSPSLRRYLSQRERFVQNLATFQE